METTAPPATLQRQNTISRRSPTDEEGNELVHPGCFSRNLMKCPCAVMWGTFAVAIVLAALPLVSGAITPSLQFAIMLDTDTVPQQVDNWAGLLVQQSDDKYEAPTSTKLDDGFNLPLYFYYEGLNAGKNMFVSEAIEAVASYERALLEMNGWTTHCRNATSLFGSAEGETRCASPQTVLRFLYTNAALEKQHCEEGFCFATEAQLSNCTDWGKFPCMSTVYDWRQGTLADPAEWPSLLAQVCNNAALTYTKTILLQTDAECTADTLSSRYVRSLYQVYSPYNESETEDGRGFVDFEEKFVDDLVELLDDTKDELSATKVFDSKVSTGGKPVNIWWSGLWTGHVDTITSAFALADMTLVMFSIIVVALIIILNTGSFLLTLAGLFEIIISIFLAMFLWMVIGQNQVAALELMGIFLILCVGADDIFVFTDTWIESASMPQPISGTLLTRFSWTYSRAAGAMLTTTATTAVSLFISGLSVFPMVQAFGLFNMFIVICDYLLVITWFAATVVCLERLTSKKCPPGRNWECSCCCPGKPQAEVKERRSTAWFRDTLAVYTFKARWLLIAISFATLAGGIAVCAVNFEDGELANLPDDHPGIIGVGGVIDMVADDKFGDADDVKPQTYLYYGFKNPPVTYPKSINIYQSNPNNEDDYDDYVDSFKMNFASGRFGPEQQKKMVEDCEVLRDNAEIVDAGEGHCLLNELKAHVGDAAFPYGTEPELREALEAFYASSRYAQLKDATEDFDVFTGFLTEGDDGISSLWHSFNSTMPATTGLSSSAIDPFYEPWRDAVDKQCSDTAPCVMTDDGFFSYKGVADRLLTSAIENIIIALVIAYFILLVFTGNFLVPLIAILSIGATITWTLASILLEGYKFDVVASILIVMIVGMSVDYAAHLVHFYNEMGGTRYEKVRGALHGVGVSVIGGALTTGGAAVPLIFTVHFTFFKEMGYFILFTALWGVFFSFLMLVPILMVCGPVGETGDIRAVIRRIRGIKSKPAADTPSGARAV